MDSIAESSNSHNKSPYPPYTDNDEHSDGPTGITNKDVEITFAKDYGLDDIHHVS